MQSINTKGFYRFTLSVLALLLLGSLIIFCPGSASAEISVTVNGDGVNTPITFTQDDLLSMEQVQAQYSSINTWPTKKMYVAQGVRLADLLQEAGIKAEARLIKVKSTDGYSMTFTKKELLDDTRWYYPGLKDNHEYYGYITGSAEGAEEVDSILALQSAESDDFADMTDSDAPLLVMGQRWVSEQTNNAFVKYVNSIEVLTTAPGKWENPVATPDGGTVAAGTQVVLSTSDMDGDNIHYTTDGSDPGIDDPMYNWIKKRWWSSRSDDLATINHTIDVNHSMTIKAVAIGFGKYDSDIVSFDYQVILDDPPALTADTIENSVYQAIDITFIDDVDWRAAITGIRVEGDPLDSSQYMVTAGNINIAAEVFAAAGDYAVAVAATGYNDATVTQQMLAADPPLTAPILTADTTDNRVGQAVDITFTDDAAWRSAITDIIVNGNSISGRCSIEPGKINIDADVFTAAGSYQIAVMADGYADAAVTQPITASIVINNPPNGQEFNKGDPVAIQGTARDTDRVNISVSAPDESTIYGPEDIAVENGEFATSFTLSSTASAGTYRIILNAVSLTVPVTSTFKVKSEGTGGGNVPAGDVILTITGDGVNNPQTFTLEQLQAMDQYEQVYSVINTWPTKKWYVGEGVQLRDLLELAGMKSSARIIKFTAEDGYTMKLTVKELLNDSRYNFPQFKEGGGDADGHIPGSSAGAQEVEPILALESAEGTDDSDYMNDLNALLLMMGQRAVTEQTGNLFVKGVNEIEVLTTSLSSWDNPEATPDGGEVDSGTLVKLSNDNMDDDKIYYTTDGSTPTVDSPMYNWIASRWWGARGSTVVESINHPIEINQTTTIKAITIGPGKKDSDVVTFTYQVKEAPTAAAGAVSNNESTTVSLDNEAMIELPANALRESGTVEVKIEKVAVPPLLPEGYKLGSGVYEFSVGGEANYSFVSPVTITLFFDPDLVGATEISSIYYYDEALKKWINLGGSVYENTISIQVNHFTKFAVLIGEASEVQPLAPLINLSDVSGHWAETAINRLLTAEAINGYPDGSFKPDNQISRAEFVTVLVKAFNLEGQNKLVFTDSVQHWAKDAIAVATCHGIVQGYTDIRFGPDDYVTREQIALMIYRAAKLSALSEDMVFTDQGSISEWARDAVAAAVKQEIIKGYPDNTFRPQKRATRAEAVTMIVNALDK